MNLIEGAIQDSWAGPVFVPRGPGPAVEVPIGGTHAEGSATLGIRPEYVRADDAGILGGEVVLDEYLGSHRYTHVRTPYGRVVMRAHASHPIGSSLRLSFDLRSLRLFRSELHA
jgi:ABC-type sugar transport system ATPase subunit